VCSEADIRSFDAADGASHFMQSLHKNEAVHKSPPVLRWMAMLDYPHCTAE
jgi:hypothetical protein